MASREITPYLPNGLTGSTRWTSTSGRWSARAPFAGLQGCGAGCGCARCGMGSISPSVVDTEKGSKLLAVSNYITSSGRFDPSRMIDAMRAGLLALGYGVSKAPQIEEYPLVWAWEYNAPNKVYQARVVGSASGPFVKAMEGLGPTTTSTPTSADANTLPTVGTVISFRDIELPNDADLRALLADLRERKTVAARGGNATNGGQLLLKTYKKPTSPVAAIAGFGLLGLITYYLIGGSSHVGTPGV